MVEEWELIKKGNEISEAKNIIETDRIYKEMITMLKNENKENASEEILEVFTANIILAIGKVMDFAEKKFTSATYEELEAAESLITSILDIETDDVKAYLPLRYSEEKFEENLKGMEEFRETIRRAKKIQNTANKDTPNTPNTPEDKAKQLQEFRGLINNLENKPNKTAEEQKKLNKWKEELKELEKEHDSIGEKNNFPTWLAIGSIVFSELIVILWIFLKVRKKRKLRIIKKN